MCHSAISNRDIAHPLTCLALEATKVALFLHMIPPNKFFQITLTFVFIPPCAVLCPHPPRASTQQQDQSVQKWGQSSCFCSCWILPFKSPDLGADPVQFPDPVCNQFYTQFISQTQVSCTTNFYMAKISCSFLHYPMCHFCVS